MGRALHKLGLGEWPLVWRIIDVGKKVPANSILKNYNCIGFGHRLIGGVFACRFNEVCFWWSGAAKGCSVCKPVQTCVPQMATVSKADSSTTYLLYLFLQSGNAAIWFLTSFNPASKRHTLWLLCHTGGYKSLLASCRQTAEYEVVIF